MKAYERLLKYVQVDTTSDPKSNKHPSSDSQKVLGNILVKEMQDLGLSDVYIDDYGYVYGTIPSNTKKNVKAIGFIAHMDTSCDMSGANIKPKIIANYDGQDVLLNNKEKVTLSVKEFPFLKDLQGQSLIVTDGTTLLGADDKAGIAEILTMAETLMKNPSIEHGTIKIAFTPDEEIGEGTLFFDVKGFNCDFAYTVDGGKEGEINYENFNAASADVVVNGINIHPGLAKYKMKNSLLIAMEFQSLLPTFLNPAYTEKYEGFNHLNEMSGNVEKTKMHYIIRNHDIVKFTEQKKSFEKIANFLNEKYGEKTIELTLKDSYFNMYEHLKDHMNIVDIAIEATKNANVEVLIKPVRGGTDGATLTYKGLMCPNLGTGGYNFHGRYECITIEGMDKATEILLNIVNIVANN